MKVSDELLQQFVDDCAARHDAHCVHMNYVAEIFKRKFSSMVGPKFARIVREGPGERSVVCFVNMTTGDILKAGGWKAPAPNGVRGNLFTEDRGASCMSEYGTKYLR